MARGWAIERHAQHRARYPISGTARTGEEVPIKPGSADVGFAQKRTREIGP
jgi:hypothetical protein